MADDSFAKFQQQFELFFNQDRAELAALRAVLQSLLVSMTANNQRGSEMLDILKMTALAQFERPLPSEATDQGATRMRELSRSEVEAFFAQIVPIPAKTEPSPSGSH